jgi:Zn finger protein HypA/HybF involved in hydrogenase expression
MIREEFIAARARLLQWLEYRTLAALVVAAVLCFPALDFFVRHGQGILAPLRAAGLAVPLIVALGVPLFLRYRAESKARALQLICPRCGASLLRDPLRAGVCSHCQAHVFQVDSNITLPSPLELYDRISAYDDAVERWQNICFAVWGGALGGGLLVQLVYWLNSIPEPPWAGWFAAVLLAVAIPGPMLYGGMRTTKLVDTLGLRCPNCNEPIVGGSTDEITQRTLRTRHCPFCGASVVHEATTPTAV